MGEGRECSICWEQMESDEDAADLKCCLTEHDDSGFPDIFSWLWGAEACPKLHRSCLAKYLIIQAESGRFPATCPFCLRKLSVVEVYKSLTSSEKDMWLRQHYRWRELREFGRPDPDLEETTLLQDLGCRRCPSCGTWIQKQSAGWVTGCDKMTCRCGARFCFQCGSVEASCDCSLGHDFLEKELVLANYSLLNVPWPLSLLFEEETAETDPNLSTDSTDSTASNRLPRDASEPSVSITEPEGGGIRCQDEEFDADHRQTALSAGAQGRQRHKHRKQWFWKRRMCSCASDLFSIKISNSVEG